MIVQARLNYPRAHVYPAAFATQLDIAVAILAKASTMQRIRAHIPQTIACRPDIEPVHGFRAKVSRRKPPCQQGCNLFSRSDGVAS